MVVLGGAPRRRRLHVCHCHEGFGHLFFAALSEAVHRDTKRAQNLQRFHDFGVHDLIRQKGDLGGIPALTDRSRVQSFAGIEVIAHGTSNGIGQHRRHGIANLLEAAGFLALELEPVGKALKPCALLNREATPSAIGQCDALHVASGTGQVPASHRSGGAVQVQVSRCDSA